MARWIAVVALLLVSACDDPIAGVETLADADLVETTGSRSIVARADTGDLLGTSNVRAAPRKAKVPDVAKGELLAFGDIARVCEAKGTKLGKKVESFGRGSQGYVLYDTKPNSTVPRTFYVTGFSDRCPRQFTAALAMFGAPSMHEQLRYGQASKKHPYSETDKAYERIKGRVCGTSRKQPCGSRISQLERNTVFISSYERFTHNGRWSDVLLHRGTVAASAIKTAQ